MAKVSKLDENWDKLFDKYKILNEVNRNGFFDITATQINEFREARLMTKFDHHENLPKLFKDNKLSILPKTRGSYVIGNFEVYNKIKHNKVKPKKLSLPSYIKSIKTNNIYSEAVALNTAFSSGVFNDILGGECLPTVSGRMSTEKFDFDIKTRVGTKFNINVVNSQCEIDGGYENKNTLALLEAKNTECTDFLIRQLYYPYRLWKNRVPNKEVVPIFMTYSNDIYSFYIYKFNNINEYNSLELVEQRDYMIGTEIITQDDILKILREVPILKQEPEVPFPQCDSFARIMDLLTLLYTEDLTKEFITQNYDFADRQTDYYTNGAIYLGLAKKYSTKDDIFISLTDEGRRIMSMSHKEKMLSIVKLILEHKAFNKCFRKYLISREIDKNEIVNVMKESKLHNIDSNDTYFRRASSISAWCKWILNLIE